MEHTETIYDAMVQQIKSGAAQAAQDLSKGVVPVVLVLALIAPAYWVGTKVNDVQRQLESSAQVTAELAGKIDALTPLVHDVANAQARLEAQARSLELAERDRKLLESRIKNLEIEIEARKRAEGR